MAAKAYGYVVAVDAFMSGWGLAKGGASIYAIRVANAKEARTVAQNMRDRKEMKAVRFRKDLPPVGPGDHLSVADRKIAPRYFEAGRPFRR